mgnify:CR=1 FL=1
MRAAGATVELIPGNRQATSDAAEARAIERVFALQDLLANRELRGVIGQIDQLPSLPGSYWALSEAIRRPDVTAEKLAGLVEQDPALTARLLQLVNSAYFGLPRRVASVQPPST